MILDELLKLAAAQAFTDADEVTTNTIDLGNPAVKRRIGNGKGLSLVFIVTTAAAGDSASITDTCDFKAVEDTAENLSTKTEIISRRIPASELTVGRVIDVPLPVDKPTKRYLGGQVVLGTGDTVSASCYVIPTDDVQAFVAYAKGYSV